MFNSPPSILVEKKCGENNLVDSRRDAHDWQLLLFGRVMSFIYNPENHGHGNILLDAQDRRARIERTKALISARHGGGGGDELLASRAWNFGTTARPPHDAIIQAAAATTAIAATTRR